MKCVLHVGCGSYSIEKLHPLFRSADWREVRLDIDPSVGPDLIASIADMQPVASMSVDAIWSSHNLEHLFSHDILPALREFKRVLKPDGFVLITLPDIEAVAKEIVAGKMLEPLYQAPAGPISALDILYGYRPAIQRGNHFMAHHTGFTAQTLGNAFVDAGFPQVMVTRGKCYDLWAKAYVTSREDPDRSGLI